MAKVTTVCVTEVPVPFQMAWFQGCKARRREGKGNAKTLLQVLDSMQPPARTIDRPLRLPLQDVYKIGGLLNL